MFFKTKAHLIIFDLVSRNRAIVDIPDELPYQCFGEYVLFESGKIRPISEYLAECAPEGQVGLDREPDVAAGELKFNYLLQKSDRLRELANLFADQMYEFEANAENEEKAL